MEKSKEQLSSNMENFRVLINIEDQYSIWPIYKKIPYGWADAGKSGTKDECLTYIQKVWTDMRPKSLKEKMAKTGE